MNVPQAQWQKVGKKLLRPVGLASLLLVLLLVLAACGGDEPTPAPAEPAATEAEAPTEEPTVAEEPAATEAPAEEAEATEEPAEEAAATEEPAEEGAATEEPAEEAEATEEPAEEPAASETMTGTEEMTGTADITATEEVTASDAMTSATGSLEGDPANGEYIATLTGGCGCHMNRDLGGLAGGNEFEVPTGIAYAANITPDPETGIGNWTAEQIANALLFGTVEVDGETEQLHPAMPYMSFSAMSHKEALDVGAYLLSLDPVVNEVPERELSEEPAAFTPANEPSAEPPSDPVARGEVLVAITNCAGCHSPKNDDGSAMDDMFLAGGPLRDETAANITPDDDTGIGSWTEDEIAHFLVTGEKPSGDMVEGAMAQQIERRFSTLTEDDAAAIAAYLKTIPAVSNDPYAAQ